MNLREIQVLAYQNGIDKKWYPVSGPPEPADLPKYLAYMHSELSEILEDWRAGYDIDTWWTDSEGKPQGIPFEFADLVIWVCSMAGYYGFDLTSAVSAKMAYNRTRPDLHGSTRA